MSGLFAPAHHHGHHHDSAERDARLAMLSARAAQVAARAAHSEATAAMALTTLDELERRIEDAVRAASVVRGDFHATGYYVTESGKKVHTGFIATFSGDDGCALSGSGRDAAGAFTIDGWRIDTTRVAFSKHYERHVVQYDGVLSDSGERLSGVWTIAGESSGAFELRFERVDPHVEPVDVAKWKGHYEQFGDEFDTSFPLRIFASGRFDGRGDDDAGVFEIDGLFLDGSSSHSAFVFTKKYAGHCVSYRGERDGSKMKGEYEGEGCGRDKFKVKRKYSIE